MVPTGFGFTEFDQIVVADRSVEVRFMAPRIKRYVPGAAMVGLVAAVAWHVFSGPSLTAVERDFRALMADGRRAERQYSDALDHAKGNAERKKARSELSAQAERVATRCVELARKYPGTAQELAALLWAAGKTRGSESGRQAADRLLNGRIASSYPAELTWALATFRGNSPGLQTLAPAILGRAKQSLDDPQTAKLLTWVCTTTGWHDEGTEVPPAFAEAADLIESCYASSPDIVNFCECLGFFSGGPPWSGRFENHLRKILNENQNRSIRCAASFSLASVVQCTGEERQPEAEGLYARFVEEFNGQKSYPYQGIEKQLQAYAKKALNELKSRGIGHPAPEIAGVDLDGKAMTLSEYRGKVVLLSFWASWCFPCMKLIPHEQELAKRLQDRPFAIVGVNSDYEEAALKDALAKYQMPWRSFRNRGISKAWDILGNPTLYLIDHAGVIRKRWIGSPPAADLDGEIDRLVQAVAKSG
jgi:thiol-disulfide isomerase/thioredoxin